MLFSPFESCSAISSSESDTEGLLLLLLLLDELVWCTTLCVFERRRRESFLASRRAFRMIRHDAAGLRAARASSAEDADERAGEEEREKSWMRKVKVKSWTRA